MLKCTILLPFISRKLREGGLTVEQQKKLIGSLTQLER